MASRMNADELANSAGTGAPSFPYGFTSAVPLNYYQGSFSHSSSWATTSNSFADGTNTGGNTLTQIYRNGLTVTAGSSNVCGVTWTPSASTAVYLITAVFGGYNSTIGDSAMFRFYDGTTAFGFVGSQSSSSSNVNYPQTLSSLYVPGTGSAVTVKIQLAADASQTNLNSVNTLIPAVVWTIIQLF